MKYYEILIFLTSVSAAFFFFFLILLVIAIVGVNLPRGVSDTTLVTANFPRDFPDNMQMQWSFTVPGMHNYTVLFDHVTSPECLNNGEVTVEYQAGAKTVTKALKDPQPEHQQGNFNMVLTNCQTNTTLPGLTLNYSVSVVRSGRPGTVLKHKQLGLVHSFVFFKHQAILCVYHTTVISFNYGRYCNVIIYVFR